AWYQNLEVELHVAFLLVNFDEGDRASELVLVLVHAHVSCTAFHVEWHREACTCNHVLVVISWIWRAVVTGRVRNLHDLYSLESRQVDTGYTRGVVTVGEQ